MKIIQNNLGKNLLLLCLLMISYLGNAQVAGTHFTVSLANVTSTSNTMDFDVKLTIDGTGASASGVKMSAMSVGINYNTAIVNGGTLTLSYVSGKSAAIAGLVNNTLNAATAGHLRIGATALTIDSSFDVVNGVYTFGRYRVTNTASWTQSSDAQLWLQPTNSGGKTNTVVNAFPYGGTTGALSYSYNSTAPVGSPGVSLGYTQVAPLTTMLNANCGIASQPVNPSICKQIGATASISVTATGAAGASYQWYTQAAAAATWTAVANNANYSGATTSTLTLNRTTISTPATGTKYQVVINGGTCSNLTSNTVTLQEFVLAKATAVSAKSDTNATLLPANTTCQGTSVNLTLAAGSIGNIQWQSSTDGVSFTNFGTVVSQTVAINPAYTLNSGNLTQDTWFRIVATNGGCTSVNSAALKIVVSSPAVAGTITGGNVTVCAYAATGTLFDVAGNPIVVPFTNSTVLTLSGSAGTILWQKSVNYTAATPVWSAAGSVTNTLTATNLTVDTWYRAIVTSGACKATTAVTKITVSKTAKTGTITATVNSVVSASVCQNGNITFTSAAYTGTSIRWEVSTTSATTGFSTVSGATGLVYTMTNVPYAPLSKFYVRSVVTSGGCTSAKSVAKAIVVNGNSVPGTVTGGGTLCNAGGATVKLAGNLGLIQWEYSTNGVNYFTAPYWKTVAGVPTFFNPANATTFTTAASTGIAATYVFSNLTATTYFRAKITNGACSTVYTNAVQYVIGTTAVAGTISPSSLTICPSTGTTLTLSGSVGAIQWQKAAVSATTGLPGTFANIGGQVGTTLATGSLTASTAYKAVVTIGSCSTVETAYMIVSVVAKPISKTITANATSPVGGSTTPLCTTSSSKVLTIGAGSTGTIQWQKSTTSTTLGFADIVGQNGTTYTIASPAAGANYYRASFTNSCGVVVYSAAVTVYYTVCRENPTEIVAETPTATQPNVVIEEQVVKTPFTAVAYPNPYKENFNLSLTTSSEEMVDIMVYDMTGRLVEQREVNPSNMPEVQVGNRYPSGIYNVIITQGSEVKTLRVIKR